MKTTDNAQCTAEQESLVSQDSLWLQKNMPCDMEFDIIARYLSCSELLTVEMWLHDNAFSGTTSPAPLQLWLSFLLARYTALRQSEIEALERKDINLEQRVLTIKGKYARSVPFSSTLARHFDLILRESTSTTFFPLRQSDFALCEQACGLVQGSLTLPSLRLCRTLELRYKGLPQAALALFLGEPYTRIQNTDYTEEQLRQLLSMSVQQCMPNATSVRNVFYGKVESIESRGILKEVTFMTMERLPLKVLLTESSIQELQIAPGTIAAANIKASLIEIYEGIPLPPSHSVGAKAGVPQNIFAGVIESVRKDDDLAEVIIRLPRGEQLCSVRYFIEDPQCKYLCVAGRPVLVRFSSAAVIITR